MLWLKIVIIYMQFPELPTLRNNLVRSVLIHAVCLFSRDIMYLSWLPLMKDRSA